MSTDDTIRVKSRAEAIGEWLDWPGKPFEWQRCDTPIEDWVFHQLHKFANDQVALRRQHEINTHAGTFRLDFLLTHRTTGRPIGIECDGRNFHSVSRDCKRDQAIMHSGCVSAIYRIRGKDCHFCGLDVLQLLAQMEPWLVTERCHEQATFYPHPTTYRDEYVGLLEGGYHGLMRTYLDQVEDEYEETECYCEGECECVPRPVMVESRERTPTVIRYMSAPGFPSAFERPAHLIPLPMPLWKIDLKEAWNQAHHNEGG